MRIYVHFGIYKAGSSYIQYLCANTREYLRSHGYFFPESVHDKRMLDGDISPGNADGLNIALLTGNESACRKIFKKWRIDSMGSGCQNVLISAEALVHRLADERQLAMFVGSAYAAGFHKIHAMGFFRDLADHAISTFKHRGKSGAITDFDHWMANVYETPQLLTNLSRNRQEEARVQWTFRKFAKKSEVLRQAFFDEWLGIAAPEFRGVRSVNESVTLSEVILMQHIRKLYPLTTDVFVNKLKSLSKEAKAKDELLEKQFYNRAVAVLTRKEVSLASMNGYLPEAEQLLIGDAYACEGDQRTDIRLSPAQLEVITQCVSFLRTFSGRAFVLRRNVVRFLPTPLVKAILGR